MAVSPVGIYDTIAADIGAAMVYLVFGYGQFFIFGDIVKIDIIVAFAIVSPDYAVFGDGGIGLVIGAIAYGDVG
jgi:hypothetical protein